MEGGALPRKIFVKFLAAAVKDIHIDKAFPAVIAFEAGAVVILPEAPAFRWACRQVYAADPKVAIVKIGAEDAVFCRLCGVDDGGFIINTALNLAV